MDCMYYKKRKIYIHGDKDLYPHGVTTEDLASLKPGSILVDYNDWLINKPHKDAYYVSIKGKEYNWYYLDFIEQVFRTSTMHPNSVGRKKWVGYIKTEEQAIQAIKSVIDSGLVDAFKNMEI